LPQDHDYAAIAHVVILLGGAACELLRNRLAPFVNITYYLGYGAWWIFQGASDLWHPLAEPGDVALVVGVIGLPMIIEGLINASFYWQIKRLLIRADPRP
jgi:hypothetical protein